MQTNLGSTTIILNQQRNPGCLMQLLWFVFIGWWAGQAWILIAWFFMAIIIGIPIGVKMINVLPRIIALRGGSNVMTIQNLGGNTVISTGMSREQHPLWLRTIWFFLAGWWLSAIAMEVGYASRS